MKNKNGYVWNSAAGFLNAGEAVLLSMVVTRTNGLADAGVLSMAFATGNLLMTIGKFGVRSYQSTDAEEMFSFSDYFWTRMITIVMMAVAGALYVFYRIWQKEYGGQKAVVILSFCFIYIIESLEDVFAGFYQQKYAIDTGAKLFIFRWSCILAVCIWELIITKDLCTAAIAGAAAGLMAFCISNPLFFSGFGEKITRLNMEHVKRVLQQCFPLFAASFMTIYVANAPKYAIDRYLTEEVQACYGFVAMPVFVIELLNAFLYQPILVHMALEWKERRIDRLKVRIKRQCLILIGVSGICLLGACFLGIPVLSALYGTDLSAYKTEMLLLLCGGAAYAYAGYFSVLLTIIRKQKVIMSGYAVISVLSFLLSNKLVRHAGAMGAAVLYLLLMTVLAGSFGTALRREMQL